MSPCPRRGWELVIDGGRWLPQRPWSSWRVRRSWSFRVFGGGASGPCWPPCARVMRTRRRAILFVLFVLVASVPVSLVRRFTEDTPVVYVSPAEHFKYGSIGSEPGGSLLNAVGGVLPPYEIFKVLPAVCPDLLPGGYPTLGFIFEAGNDLPRGVHDGDAGAEVGSDAVGGDPTEVLADVDQVFA